MFILVAALIGLNSLAPIAASTAETMYTDLVEPIIQSNALPADKAQKLYDLKKQIEIDKKKIDFHIGDDKSLNGFLVSLYALLCSALHFANLYQDPFENNNYARNCCKASFAICSALFVATTFISCKERWQLYKYVDKSEELSHFIAKLEVLLEQLPKEYQKAQLS